MLLQKQQMSEQALREREAAFFQFQKEIEKKRKLKVAAASGQSGQGSKALIAMARKGVKDFFETWVRYWRYRLASKVTCEKFFVQFLNRTLNAGFQQWKKVVEDMLNFERVGGKDDPLAGGAGIGSMLLSKVDQLRKNNLLDASAMLLSLKNIRMDMKKMETTPLAQRTLQSSSEYIQERERKQHLESIEEEERKNATKNNKKKKKKRGKNDGDVVPETKEVSIEDLSLAADDKADLTAGDCYARFRDWSKSIHCYERYLARMMEARKPRDQAVAYGKLGNAHFENKSFDQAILQWRSMNALVSELDGERTLLAKSFMGMGRTYFEMADYKMCARHFISALMTYQVRVF